MKTYTIRVNYTATKELQLVAKNLEEAIRKAKEETEDMNKNTFFHKFDKAEETTAPLDIPDDLDDMIEQVKVLMQDDAPDSYHDISGICQRKTRSTYGDAITIECHVEYIYLEDDEIMVSYDVNEWEDDEPLTELDPNVQYAILIQAIEALTN